MSDDQPTQPATIDQVLAENAELHRQIADLIAERSELHVRLGRVIAAAKGIRRGDDE